ncbi:MAG: hypothetical protein AAF449_12175, partial [Myxococcota bacterium]
GKLSTAADKKRNGLALFGGYRFFASPGRFAVLCSYRLQPCERLKAHGAVHALTSPNSIGMVMKRLPLLFIGTAMVLVLTASTITSPETQATYAVLSVTSAVEGEEVTFEGKYLSLDLARTEPNEVLEARQTPFEVRIDEAKFYGLFRTLEEGTDIKVNVMVYREDGTWVSGSETTGEVGLVMHRGGTLTTTFL